MSEEITITIGNTGRAKIEVEGVVGGGCRALTESIEQRLSGGKTGNVETHLKDEFFQVNTDNERQRQRL